MSSNDLNVYTWDKQNKPNSVGNDTVIHYYIKKNNLTECCDWPIKMKYLQIVMK